MNLSQITDLELRKELRKRNKLRKKRSRQAHGLGPRKKPGSYERKGHEYLEGMLAHVQRRIDVYRNAGGQVEWFDKEDPGTIQDLLSAYCQGCAETHLVGWADGEWHHNVKTLGGRRCDCVACGLWVCADWHKRYHGRVIRSGKVGA